MGVSAGVESFSKIQRLILGVSVLIFVNVLSVLSTILDRRLFADEDESSSTGERPFFTTFLKAAVCSVYLSGFLLFRGWREQCRGNGNGLSSAFLIDDEAGPPPYQSIDPRISEPHYVPIKFDGDHYEIPPYADDEINDVYSEKWRSVRESTPAIPSHILANIAPDYRQKTAPRSPPVIQSESCSSSSEAASVSAATAPKTSSGSSPNLISKLKKKGRQIKKHLATGRSVRFQKWTEVRILNETYAEAAVLARMSYQASLRMQALFKQAASRLTLGQVLKVSFIFSLLWFMAHLASAEALVDPEMPLVQILFSSSGLFTLILAAIFPSSNHDKFTLSKLVAVLFSIGGSVLVCFPLLEKMPSPFPLRSLWAIAAAFLVSTYVVYFQRQAENEDRLNIPLFLGFVGLFSMMLMWPGFFIARELNAEAIVWPTKREWIHLSVNLVACTFVSEVLWLWGCLLTSSLVATSALTLKVPLNVMACMTLNHYQVPGTWFIYVGSLPISLGFLSIAAFSYYDTWDPVFIALKKLVHCIFRFRCCWGSSPRGKSHHHSRHHHSRSSAAASSSSSCDSHDLKEQKESLILNEQKCASS